MNREALDQWCERGLLGLVLGILVLGPLTIGAVQSADFLILQALTVAVIGLGLARLWLRPGERILWPPVCWGVAAFALYAVGRYLTADIEYVARQELVRVLLYTALFLTLVQHLHRLQTIRILTWVWLMLALAISVYALYQFATRSPRVWAILKPEIYLGRSSGTFICPNSLAGFLEMILPLGLALVFLGRLGHVARILVAYASLVILAGIVVTFSRGGWAATGVSLIFMLAVLLRNRRLRIPAAILMVIVLGSVFQFARHAHQAKVRFREMFVAGKFEDVRFLVWKPAVQIWRENPWFGAGPGHFDSRFRQYRPEEVQKRPEHVHNDYLNTLTDWGVIGAALVASVWVLLFLGARKSWKFVYRRSAEFGAKPSNKAAFVLGASAGLVAILVHSWVDFNMHVPANAILAVTLMALLASHLRFATDRYWAVNRWPLRALLTVALAALGVYLGQQGIQRYREQCWLTQANRLNTYSTTRIQLLEKAWAVDPRNAATAYELGETYRNLSWDGESDYRELGEKALTWFDRALRLNPYDGFAYARYGMCLHWLGRGQEAQAYFDQARALDPNGNYMLVLQAWHRIQTGDLAGARDLLERSMRLNSNENAIGASYLTLVRRKLSEAGKP